MTDHKYFLYTWMNNRIGFCHTNISLPCDMTWQIKSFESLKLRTSWHHGPNHESSWKTKYVLKRDMSPNRLKQGCLTGNNSPPPPPPPTAQSFCKQRDRGDAAARSVKLTAETEDQSQAAATGLRLSRDPPLPGKFCQQKVTGWREDGVQRPFAV